MTVAGMMRFGLLVLGCVVVASRPSQLSGGAWVDESYDDLWLKNSAIDTLAVESLLNVALVNAEDAFRQWIGLFKRPYKNNILEYHRRLSVFKDNVARITKYRSTDPAAQFGLNAYADLTWEEFSAAKLGFKSNEEARALRSTPFRYKEAEAPAAVDWRDQGLVTDVKNQGQCGSCWAFSTTGSIEGINAMKTGQLVSLSEQELIDCDHVDQGCNGGLMDLAFDFIVKNGGIDSEDDYSYWSKYGVTLWACNRKKEHDRTVVTIDGFEDVPANDEVALQQAVANQPVSVAICANTALQFYSGGIFSDHNCHELNHGVLAVGYGKDESGAPYWIVKNSWGGWWGEQGFFRLKMWVGSSGMLGIAKAASYPVKDSPNPSVPEECDMFAWQECPAGSSCSCKYNLFGLLCVLHDCCPAEDGVTCPDQLHCCPGNMPVCNVEQQTCSSEDGSLSATWLTKGKASELESQAKSAAAEAAAGSARVEAGEAQANPAATVVV